jgi:hypothetical protein
MPQRGNLLNDFGIERLRNDPEIIGSRYPHFMLQTRKIQSILRHFVHVMAKDATSNSWVIEMTKKSTDVLILL